jgi:hypothetical protein
MIALVCLMVAAARPAAACCQLGGSACGDPFALDCNNGVVCFVPFRSCPACTCATTNEGHTCLPTSSLPGRVPTLFLDRSAQTAGDIDFSWGMSCTGAGPDYSVHEGVLGDWYTHARVRCTSLGALSLTLTPSGGNRYYLIAPISGSYTGSLGTNSAGTERPDGSPSCTDERALAPCP